MPPLLPLLSRSAALLAPCVVIGLVAWALTARAPDEERSWRNAGQVLNGRRLPRSVADHIDARVAERPPRVVVLGNSNAHTDLEARLLAERLGVDPADVLVLSVPLSVGAHWYAMLQRRLYDAGARPELVVVVSRLQLMLWTEPLSEAGWVNLHAHTDPPVAEVTARTGSGGPRWWRHLRAGRVNAREGLRRGVREASLAWLGPGGDDPGQQLAEAVDAGLLTPAVLRQDRPALPSVDDSYLPAMAELVARHGGQLVLARPPVAPHVSVALADDVRPEVVDSVAAWADAEAGVHWLDLSSLRVVEEHWKNPTHLGSAGARQFTAALATGLDARAAGVARAPAVGVGPDGLSPVVPRIESGHPPRVVQGDLAVDGRWGRFPSAELAPMADPRVAAVHPLGARCSPVEVWLGGAPLPRTTCRALPRWPVAASCHEGDQVTVHTPEPTLHEGEVPRLMLAADRWCQGAVWVYPGDRVRVGWPGRQEGGRALVLQAHPFGRQGALRVVLEVDGEVVLDTSGETEAWPMGPLRWAIPEVGADAEVVLELSADRDFVLVTQATLEGAP